MPIASQQVAKHIPAEAYSGTIRRPFLGNGKHPKELLRDGVFRGVLA
jgi:hypothetical protein